MAGFNGTQDQTGAGGELTANQESFVAAAAAAAMKNNNGKFVFFQLTWKVNMTFLELPYGKSK